VRYADFESLVRRLAAEVPREFLEGIAGVEVSGKTLPHPTRADVWTMGECIPLPAGGGVEPDEIQSRVVLYHGSFQALSRSQSDFDWRAEAWETLTHELRHHLEWRARAPDLEAFDEAAEHNFARQDGEPFDPLFYLSAEPVVPGVYRLDDDFFIDQVVSRMPADVRFGWHGRAYRAVMPPGATLPALLEVDGVEDPPPGDLVLALRRRPGLRSLFARPEPWQGKLVAEPG
jgi:zinicin-like metallopeptidase